MVKKMRTKNASDLAKEYYTEYAIYVNQTRAEASIYDGLKDVQRRLIYSTSNKRKNNILWPKSWNNKFWHSKSNNKLKYKYTKCI